MIEVRKRKRITRCVWLQIDSSRQGEQDQAEEDEQQAVQREDGAGKPAAADLRERARRKVGPSVLCLHTHRPLDFRISVISDAVITCL